MTDKTAPQVTIAATPTCGAADDPKAYAEGPAGCLCMPLLTRTTLWPNGFQVPDHDMAHRVDDLPLPIVRAWVRTRLVLTESLRALGGSGFD